MCEARFRADLRSRSYLYGSVSTGCDSTCHRAWPYKGIGRSPPGGGGFPTKLLIPVTVVYNASTFR